MTVPPVDDDRVFEFTVRIKSFGNGRSGHLRTVTMFLWTGLHRAFGADRVEVYWRGRRVTFDPLAADGEHVGHEDPLTLA